ncbi:Uncharacterised protein [Chlamydia trachomatis]|nr:Uncharacterised protein [Chlamydia trachomatis]
MLRVNLGLEDDTCIFGIDDDDVARSFCKKPVAALATRTGENVENSSAGLNVKDLVNCGLSTGDAVREFAWL